MKKAKELKVFKRKMTNRKTASEQKFYNLFSEIYTKDELKTQCILGFYILDFVIVPKLLVIEIDGSSHNDKKKYDAYRDAFIRASGLDVLHITNEEVDNHLDNVLTRIGYYLTHKNSTKLFRSALGKANAIKSQLMRGEQTTLRAKAPGNTA